MRIMKYQKCKIPVFIGDSFFTILTRGAFRTFKFTDLKIMIGQKFSKV